MKEKQIRVLRVKPNAKPLPDDIDNTLDALQNEVGGYIETVSLPGGTVIICNEEGALKGFVHNRALVFKVENGGSYQVDILGNFIICGTDGDEFRGLSGQEIKDLTKQFDRERVIFKREAMK